MTASVFDDINWVISSPAVRNAAIKGTIGNKIRLYRRGGAG